MNGTQDGDIENDDEVENIIKVQPIRRYFNFRPTRHMNYSNIQLLQDTVTITDDRGEKEPVFKHLTGIIMTQMSDKAGINKSR